VKRQDIKQKISSFLLDEGMSVVGVAAPEQMQSLQDDFSPQVLLRGVKSVICFGTQIPKGVLYAERNDLDLYWRYCNIQYRMLDSISNKISTFLEEKSSLACPIYSCFPWKVVNREFWGQVPLVYWAEEAGLGRLAKCGLLITPQFGTRILLGGVITTMKLEPDEKLDENLCPYDCFNCIDACPSKAISRSGKINHNLCIRHSSVNPLLALVLSDEKIGKNFPFETLLNTIAIDDHGTYACNECLKECPLNKR
jgi:epoxyqueuosine reductase QueG